MSYSTLMNSVYESIDYNTLCSDMYYMAFPKDRTFRKTLVAFSFVMELVQTVMATHDGYRALASGWGTKDALDHVYWSCVDIPFM